MSEANLDVIVVLGASNDAQGGLTPTAVARAECALGEYCAREGSKMLITGGFGPHFNVGPEPHARYVRRYLVSRGVRPADILGLIESRNTIEDATMTKRALARTGVRSLCVVTSDYHLARAKRIFERVLCSHDLRFVASSSRLSPEEYEKACQHEADALRCLEGWTLEALDGFEHRAKRV